MAKEAAAGNSSGVFAMVMAVLSIILPVSAVPFGIIGGLICGVLGLVFGIIQVKKGKNGWAVTAIVISVIGIVFNIIFAYAIVAVINSAVAQYNAIQQQYGGALNQITSTAGNLGGLNGTY